MAGLERHEALQELSRHHHRALVLALQLRRATQENEADVKEAWLDFWKNGGHEHFIEEETLLLPLYAKVNEIKQNPDVMRMLLDHVSIRQLALMIERDEAKLEDLHQLGELLKEHVHFEEHELFPVMQSTIYEEDLAFMKPRFHEMIDACQKPL